MKNVSQEFKDRRAQSLISGFEDVRLKVELIDLATEEITDLYDDYIISIGGITNRFEKARILNEFVPSEVAVTVLDPENSPILFKTDGSGLFDDLSKKFRTKVYFGFELNEIVGWVNLGRLGSEQRVMSLLRFDGNLYGGTYGSGLVLRYNAIDDWTQIGALGISADNIFDLKEFENKMYAATSVTGKVFRRDADNDWADMGQLGNGSAVFCLLKFDGNFYAGTNVSGGADPSEVWRMDGVANWTGMGQLPSVIHARCLNEFNGGMFVGTRAQGKVFLFISQGNWTDYGQLGTNQDIYTLETHEGNQYGAGYGDGHVYRMDGIGSWTSIGQPVPALKIIYKLKSYNGALYAFTDNSNVYKWEGGISWSEMGQPGTNTKIYSAEISDGKLNIGCGSQGEVYSYFSGGLEEHIVFDGVLRNDSIERSRRTKVQFTSIGWLKEAEKFNAELIADEDANPFKNITAIEVAYDEQIPIQGDLGAKTLICYGREEIDGSWVCGFSYMGGRKVYILPIGSGVPYRLRDPTRKQWITIKLSGNGSAEFDNLPDELTTDEFTVIEVGGSQKACNWYENRTLEFILNKIIDFMWGEGVGDRDIDVRELETGLSKDFIYLTPVYPANPVDIKITASQVVDVTGSTITMLVGVEVEKNVKNYLYKIVIDTSDTDNMIVTDVGGTYPVDNRICKFVKFDSRLWAVGGKWSPSVMAIEEDSWYGTKLYRIATDFNSIDKVKDIPSSLIVGGYWYLAYSFSSINDVSAIIHCLRQTLDTGDVEYHYALWISFYSETTGNFSDIEKLHDPAVAYQKSTASTLDGALQWFHYSILPQDPVDYHFLSDPELYGYCITTTNKFLIHNRVLTNICWRTRSSGRNMILVNEAEAWIDTDGISWISILQDDSFHIGGNSEEDTIYSGWRGGDYGYKIESFAQGLGGNVEGNYLDGDYIPDLSSPKIFKDDGVDDYLYVGCVTDGAHRVVPFLYLKGVMPTIKIADFKDWNCRDALSKCCEAFLDVLSIPEMRRIIIRYRNTHRDSDALDWDQYDDTPVTKIWRHFYDGIRIKNTKHDLISVIGDFGVDAKILEIDNRLISSNIIDEVAEWYYDFFNYVKKTTLVKRDMYIEPEGMDLITLTQRSLNGSIFWSYDTLVMETSFVASRKGPEYYRMKLSLLQKTGSEYRSHNLIRRGRRSSSFIIHP